MKKQIEFNGRPITYTLRNHPRAKYLRLTVQRDGSVAITAPYGLGVTQIEQFILQKFHWLIDKIDHLKKQAVPVNPTTAKIEFLRNKVAAKKLATQRLAHFNLAYHFTYTGVTIRNQSTRWGSCSKLGRLNFNYKIALLPTALADYIIVHELCHLGEFNHSKKFWNLVARTIPDFAARRAALKKFPLTP